MKRNALLLAGIMVAAGFYTSYSDFYSAPSQEALPAPQQAVLQQKSPDAAFARLEGKTEKLSDYAGRPIILNFWASWCAPCVAEMPQMFALAKENPNAVFVFLSVDDTISDIAPFLARFKGQHLLDNIVVGWDRDKKISQDIFQTFRYPETYLIDEDFKISAKIIGLTDWDSDEMKQKILSLQRAP